MVLLEMDFKLLIYLNYLQVMKNLLKDLNVEKSLKLSEEQN